MAITTESNIKNIIKYKLEGTCLSIENVRGQGYDGDTAIFDLNKGVQVLISNEYQLALYTHCFWPFTKLLHLNGV